MARPADTILHPTALLPKARRIAIAAVWLGLAAAAAAQAQSPAPVPVPAPATAAAPAPGTLVEWPASRWLDGRPLVPPASQGKAAIVVFWATHCPFCKRHNAHVDKVHRALGAEPVVVIGAALDEDAGAVARYMATNDYRFPVLAGAERLRPRFTSRRVIPTTCVLDRSGRLHQCIAGEMFEEDVQELVALALRSVP